MSALTCVALLGTPAVATDAGSPDTPPLGETYALVVGGISRQIDDRLAREQVLRSLRTHLLKTTRIEPERLIVLTAEATSGDANHLSTAERLSDAVTTLAATVHAEDRLLLYYAGQANVVGDRLRFNVPGPDVTDSDLARHLAQINARTQLVVLDCPCAAVAAKSLAGPGRIIVCATKDTQTYAPRFGLHFVPALTEAANDTNADGKVSVLEAFAAAAKEIEQWYRDNNILPTETPCLEDDSDGVPSEQPWRYAVDATDGRATAVFFLAGDE
jgi:hypothetical protein